MKARGKWGSKKRAEKPVPTVEPAVQVAPADPGPQFAPIVEPPDERKPWEDLAANLATLETNRANVLDIRRAIGVMHVLGVTVPRSIRIHDHLSLGPMARRVRKELAEAGKPLQAPATFGEIMALVAKYVPTL